MLSFAFCIVNFKLTEIHSFSTWLCYFDACLYLLRHTIGYCYFKSSVVLASCLISIITETSCAWCESTIDIQSYISSIGSFGFDTALGRVPRWMPHTHKPPHIRLINQNDGCYHWIFLFFIFLLISHQQTNEKLNK